MAIAARRTPEGMLAMGVAAEIAKCVYEAANVLHWRRVDVKTYQRENGLAGWAHLMRAHEAAHPSSHRARPSAPARTPSGGRTSRIGRARSGRVGESRDPAEAPAA